MNNNLVVNKKSLTELYYIISNLEEKYKSKIPATIIDTISKNMDRNYVYNGNNEILPETKALLAAIIEKYFCDADFNKKIQEYVDYCHVKFYEFDEDNQH